VEFESTLNGLRAFGAMYNTSKCWEWVLGMESDEPVSCIVNKVQEDWFNEISGYDLNAIAENADFGRDQKWVLGGLASVNLYRRENRKKLDNLTANVQTLGPLAPYNSLFDLTEKHEMKYNHFLKAYEPPIDDLSLEERYDIEAGYVMHLRPGRMLSFRNAHGDMVKTAIRECSRCKKVKEGVRDEHCELKRCETLNSVCRNCATERTCSSCRRTKCNCHFAKCRILVCQNYMCNDVQAYEYEDDSDDDDGKGPGCSFVIYPAEGLHLALNLDLDDDGVKHKFCKEHKPAGAVKLGIYALRGQI
jgi:hypothetical protein